ncbi:MAG TPA: autotransporter domain-containing protein, partial [Chthoniobacteraceae bacterium]|nr:autotransporter domain-containing protein [Chthoniobacteraceae bacterium]
MKNTLKKLSVLTALALLACSIEQARAQNNWTNVGPSPGGGFIIDGSSAPTDLGQLSTSSTPVFMSSNGFNIITVEPGNTATGDYVIDITNNHNVLNNEGTLSGSNYPVYIYGSGNTVNNTGTVSSNYDPVWEEGIQNNTFNNWGAVTSTGYYIIYTDGSHFTLNNYSGGAITGGTYDAIYSDGDHFTFNNSGLFSGSDLEYGIESTGNFFTLNNKSGGQIILPGAGYDIYTTGNNATVNNSGLLSGSGVSYGIYTSGNFFTLNNNAGGQILFPDTSYGIYSTGNNATVNNSGMISGASVSYGIYTTGNFFTLNNGVGGVISGPSNSYNIYSGGANATLNNSGVISGSSSSYTIYSYGPFLTLNNYSGGVISGNGNSYVIYLEGGNATVNNWGNFSMTTYSNDLYIAGGSNNVVNNHGMISSGYIAVYDGGSHDFLNNWGMIAGGSTGGEYGVYNEGSYLTLNNYAGGTITAVGTTVYSNGSHFTLNNWGTVAGPDDTGIEITQSNHNTINNWGSITAYYYTVSLEETSRNVLNNWGTITGTDGVAVYLDKTSRNVINNWGAITTVGGTATGYDTIEMYSAHNNILNLDGHSSVNGKILIDDSNNTVNLNFTGLSPATIASLKATLLPQGVNSGTATTATFTVRGVTYNIDPAIITFNPSSYQLQAKTPNQAAVGAALDSIPYNPAPGTPLFTMFNAIDTSGNVPGALDQLSPADYAALGDIAISQSDFLVNSIDARLNNIRNGSESIDTSSVGGATVAGLTKDDGHEGKSSKEIQPAAAPTPDRWGFFATGDGLFFRGSQRDIGLADKSNTAGTLIGVDGKVGDKGVIGAMFSYDNTSAELGNPGSHANIESYSGGLYGSFHDGGFYLNSLAAYTRNVYHTTRNLAIAGLGATANGSTNGNQETVNADGGYDFNLTDRIAAGPV